MGTLLPCSRSTNNDMRPQQYPSMPAAAGQQVGAMACSLLSIRAETIKCRAHTSVHLEAAAESQLSCGTYVCAAAKNDSTRQLSGHTGSRRTRLALYSNATTRTSLHASSQTHSRWLPARHPMSYVGHESLAEHGSLK